LVVYNYAVVKENAVSYYFTNQKRPSRTLALTHGAWTGALTLAESYGWRSFSPVYPGQGLAHSSWLAGSYLGVPLISPEDDVESARTLMLTEDALSLADAIERAYLAYEPVRLPVAYFLFADDALEARLVPGLGVMAELIDFCRMGAFWIDPYELKYRDGKVKIQGSL
jgi:hypothetical protein